MNELRQRSPDEAARVTLLDKLVLVLAGILAAVFPGERLGLANWPGVFHIKGDAILVAWRTRQPRSACDPPYKSVKAQWHRSAPLRIRRDGARKDIAASLKP